MNSLHRILVRRLALLWPDATKRDGCGCRTQGKDYRVDFVFIGPSPKQQIGIECDGREYHKSVPKDAARDVAIIRAKCLAKIYRIPGYAIHRHIYDVLDLLSLAEPWLFSDRGRDIIKGRSAPEHLRTDTWGYMTDTMQGALWRSVDYPETDDPDDQQYFNGFTIRWTPLKDDKEG